MNRAVKATVYYLSGFLQGVCLVLIPGASFILKSAAANGITDPQYGLLFLPMISVAALVTWFFKPLLKKLREESVFFIGVLANLFYLGLLWHASFAVGKPAQSFFEICLSNIFLGAGFGLFLSVLNLLTVELFPKTRNSALTGLHACLGLGSSASPLLVNIFYQRGSWPTAVVLTAVSFIILGIISWVFRAARHKGHEAERILAAEIPVGPAPLGMKGFLAAIFLYAIAESMIGNWSAVYLQTEKGFSLKTASLTLSVFWLFVTVGRVLASFLVTKIDARYLYRFSPAFIGVSLLAIILNRTESLVLFLYAFAGLACSYFFPLSISLSTHYFDRWRGQISGLAIAALMLGVGVGSSLVGILKEYHGLNLGQAFSAALACVAAVFLMTFSLTRKALQN